MTINFLAIIILSIASFIAGAFWFSPKMFGKTWMRIHRTENKTPEEMKESMKGMRNLLITEFVLTLIMNFFLYLAVTQSPSVMFVFATVFILWLGFVLPSITSSVLWGNDEKRFMFKKILLSSGFRLIVMLVSGWIFFVWR